MNKNALFFFRIIRVALIMALVPLMIAIRFPWMLRRIKKLQKRGEKVEATVIRSRVIPQLDGKYRARITYQFVDKAGHKREKTVDLSDRLQVADKLTVIYLPEKSSINCPETAINNMLRVENMIIDGIKS